MNIKKVALCAVAISMLVLSSAGNTFEDGKWPVCDEGLTCTQTQYPQMNYPELMADFHSQVKVAFPNEKGARLWIKGNKNTQSVTITAAEGKIVGRDQVEAPFFSTLVGGLPFSEELTVTLHALAGGKREIRIPPISDLYNFDTRSDYSIGFYGCFQPFTVKDTGQNLQPDIYTTANGFPVKFMNLFSDALLDNQSPVHSSIFPRTSLVVGTGDQVYMDAGYEAIAATRGNMHPLSAWTTNEPKPKLLRTGPHMVEHVEATYRAFGSFPAMNSVFQSIYQVNAWDDHEIRDGWGSQGDEYVDGKINPNLSDAYEIARKGYIDHQYLVGPVQYRAQASSPSLKEAPPYDGALYQTFELGDVKGFVLDLRTNRNSAQKQVLGSEQKMAFSSWISNLPKDQLIVIVSSMPVFLRNNELVESAIIAAMPDIMDDVKDGWASPENEIDHRWLISTVLKARLEKNIKPIFVSGDYHKAALSEIWLGDQAEDACSKKGEEGKSIFGFEMIASGLFHEGIAKGIAATGFDRAEAQRIGKHFIKDLEISSSGQDNIYCLDPHVERSVVGENFGGLVIRPNDGSSDSLRLVVGRENTNRAEVYELELSWDKKFDRSIEKEYVGLWQNLSYAFSFLPFVDDIYTPKGTIKIEEFLIQ